MITVTDDSFEQEVLKSDVPVLVDFYADWCGPCKAASPVIEAIAEEFAGRAKVVKIDVDKNTKQALALNVRGIPNFIIFNRGERIAQFIGWNENVGDSLRTTLEVALASK